MDVVRAADPASVREAHRKLMAAPDNAPQAAFEAAASRPVGASVNPQNDDVPKAYRDFEAMVLQSFIGSMLPSDAENTYGSGTAGDIWKGMMAEQLGKALAEGGGLGIARQMAADRLAQQSETPQADAGQVKQTGDNRSFAAALIHQMQVAMLHSAEESAALHYGGYEDIKPGDG